MNVRWTAHTQSNWVTRTQHSEHMLREMNAAFEFPSVNICFGIHRKRECAKKNPNNETK